jgi:hypothetical protein
VNALSTKLKFRVDWMENRNVGSVIAMADDEHKIGELFWNGSEWLFIRWTIMGEVHDPINTWIDVDPGRRIHLNKIADENLKGSTDRNPTVQAALDAALDTRRREFRDDTRDLAVIGAKMHGRFWWQAYSVFLKGCTGNVEKIGGLWVFDHDDITCPVHEA